MPGAPSKDPDPFWLDVDNVEAFWRDAKNALPELAPDIDAVRSSFMAYVGSLPSLTRRKPFSLVRLLKLGLLSSAIGFALGFLAKLGYRLAYPLPSNSLYDQNLSAALAQHELYSNSIHAGVAIVAAQALLIILFWPPKQPELDHAAARSAIGAPLKASHEFLTQDPFDQDAFAAVGCAPAKRFEPFWPIEKVTGRFGDAQVTVYAGDRQGPKDEFGVPPKNHLASFGLVVGRIDFQGRQPEAQGVAVLRDDRMHIRPCEALGRLRRFQTLHPTPGSYVLASEASAGAAFDGSDLLHAIERARQLFGAQGKSVAYVDGSAFFCFSTETPFGFEGSSHPFCFTSENVPPSPVQVLQMLSCYAALTLLARATSEHWKT